MHIHVTRFMWQNGLLCAHYVDRKWVVWGLFWVNFAVVGAMKFPVGVVSAREGLAWPGDAGYGVCQGLLVPLGAALKSFALQALDSARLALFCRKHGAFMWVYVGFCGCFRGGLLCVFTWVTLSKEANRRGGSGAGGGPHRTSAAAPECVGWRPTPWRCASPDARAASLASWAGSGGFSAF